MVPARGWRSDVVRRKQAILPISREMVKAVIRRSFSARAVASGSMAGYLWPPTARSTAGEDFSLAGSVRKRGSAGFLALALCPPLAASALFRRSGRYGHRNLAQAPALLVQTNRAGGALRFRFWLSSVNTTVACQVM
jgi:hypothetical protein